MSGPLAWLDDEMAAWEAAGLRRRLRTVSGVGPHVQVDGRTCLNLCSNSYLGLHDHPRIRDAAQDASRMYGPGSGASRLVSGNLPIHRELESAIAELKGTEDAVLFASGFAANVGTIPALAGRGDLVVSDRLNHASIIDGCRLSGADVQVFPHGDAEALRALLRSQASSHRRTLVVTDGVFSMDGDEAPLDAIADACEDAGAMLMVDDAHGTGVLGDGCGTAHDHGVADRVDVHMGTLSKALGAEGGFVAGSTALCEHLRNRARSFVFSTALAPSTAAAALVALRVVRDEPERRDTLLRNARRLRDGMRVAGFDVPAGRTPIVPLVLGDARRTMAVAAALEKRGVLAVGIRPPTVPQGAARIRATVMASHSDADIDAAIASFAAVAGTAGLPEARA